jgi:hypothetical protein
MKISEVKVIHFVLIAVVALWIWLFTDMQITKRQMGFNGWQRDVAAAINDINGRVKAIEGKGPIIVPPEPQPPKNPKVIK